MTAVTSADWVECAADVSAVKLVQLTDYPPTEWKRYAMFTAASTKPAADFVGPELEKGEEMLASDILALGWTTGKLWGKARAGTVNVLVL